MKINFKTFIIFCCFYLFILGPFWVARAKLVDIDLQFKGKTLSVNLNGVMLKAVFEKLERGKGIWFRGDEALFEEEVTVQFKGLSLQDGLKRILSSMNYCLLFDQDRKLNGVIILGKEKPGQSVAKDRAVRDRKSISSRNPNEHVTNSGAFKVAKNIPPSDGSVKVTAKDLENFKVARNIPPPGGYAKVTSRDLDNFKAIKNSPPPGGAIEITAEALQNFKVIKNCPPPGGPVNVTPEELEKFKVIKNCPPPGS